MDKQTNFKLIAIIPHAKCIKAFSKALNPGQVYQFHAEYEIRLSAAQNAVECLVKIPNKATPETLYSLSNGVALSFSAIVGKNGTGKSSLMELFYRAVYYLGIRSNYRQNRLLGSSVEKLEGHLGWLRNELYNLLTQTDLPLKNYPVDQDPPDEVVPEKDLGLYLLEVVRRHRLTFDINRVDGFEDLPRVIAAELKSRIADTVADIKTQEKYEQEMEQGFHVSIVYETGEGIFELRCSDNAVGQSRFLQDGSRDKQAGNTFDLESFFYTVSLNYSHHGLNAITMGKWVNKLFHKNDAYITPLVLNPMRDDGNVDINKELRLSKERLASTILYELVHKGQSLQLEKYTLTKFIFSVKKSAAGVAAEPAVNPQTGHVDHWEMIREKYGIDPDVIKLPNGQLALEYLSSKLTKISSSYGFLINGEQETVQDLSNFLADDNSHITRKIRQTINYLKGELKTMKKIWSTADNSDPAFIELPEPSISEYMDTFGLILKDIAPSKLIEYAFPGFFDVDFEFSYLGKPIRLSEMSSGEQQMIFNSNAVLYHLYNIQSVALNNADPSLRKRPEYQYINIVLDEMELYYHPEMQRRLVADIVRDLNKLSPSMGIKGIHVCILTHSPFVLSDIPVQSTLRLCDEKDHEQSYDHQSFGANIHELLKKDFFLKDGFMGEHARTQILMLIDSLKAHQFIPKAELQGKTKALQKKRMSYARKLSLNEDFLAHRILSKPQCEAWIAIVGEPVLYQSLMELYHQAFGRKGRAFIQNQIEFLQRLQNNNP